MSYRRKIKYGMIGGGPGSFVGPIHRKAAGMDGNMELVAGSFSSSLEKSYQTGKELFLDRDRVYGSYLEMIEKERKLPAEKRLDFVSIVTPNYIHFPAIKACLEAGFNVVCDKPLVGSIEEADEICKLVKKTGSLFAVTYCFTGNPMVKQAKEMVQNGVLGQLQKVVVEYSNDFLLRFYEIEKVMSDDEWRLVPEKVGKSLCLGDIGTHAENLASYITGLEIEKLNAMTNTSTKGIKLDDEANILIKYQNDVRGILLCSIVAAGETNNLNIRVYGKKASLEWYLSDAEVLILRIVGEPEKIYKKDSGYLYPLANYNVRYPLGHCEGYADSFANIYNRVANTLIAREEGKEPNKLDLDFPTVIDGARGVYFIERALESGKSEQWVDMGFDPSKY